MKLALKHKVMGLTDYPVSLQAMKDFVAAREPDTTDEIWYVEHPPVFTQGMAGKSEHLLKTSDIPVIQTDRGGQVTYHGPGQIVGYLMIDISRRQLGVRKLVQMIEQAVIDLLADYRITAYADRQAPGVYVDGAKVAALGLRVRRHSTYHGLSLNVDMDLSPFQHINPCGYPGLQVTSVAKLGITDDIEAVRDRLHYHLTHILNYQHQPLSHAA
jgi:lipoyl(octanoyl) transferase